ncbi:MAG: hypothetical protein ACRD16_07340 [Thermoanaerobaculia bacterium]
MTDILDQASAALRNRGEVSERYDEVRSDAAERAARLLGEAKREGAELLALAARHGVELAREFGVPLITGIPSRRRRSPWKILAAAAAVAAIAAVIAATSRD